MSRRPSGPIFAKKNIFRRSSNINGGAGASAVPTSSSTNSADRHGGGRWTQILRRGSAPRRSAFRCWSWLVGWGPPWLFSAVFFIAHRWRVARIFRHGLSRRSRGSRLAGMLFGSRLRSCRHDCSRHRRQSALWLSVLLILLFSSYSVCPAVHLPSGLTGWRGHCSAAFISVF